MSGYGQAPARVRGAVQGMPGGLRRGEEGCWFPASAGPVSYPASGNEDYYAVEDASFWFQHRNACLLALMRRLPPPGVLFDVGGGNGVVAAALQESGLDVVLVEPGFGGARNARRRGVESVICGRLEDAGFSPGTLPSVGLFDVLEHIEDDLAFLRTLTVLLIPGGRLYLTVPACWALWSKEDLHVGHFRRYRLRTLRRILRNANLRVDYMSYMFWVLPVPIFLHRTLPSMLGLGPASGSAQIVRDHVAESRDGRVLKRLLHSEVSWIEEGRRIPCGSSCLVAATRAL